MILKICPWLFSLALVLLALGPAAVCQGQQHYVVQDEKELRDALQDPQGLANDELVIRIDEPIEDIQRPFVYEESSDLRLTGRQNRLASYGRCRVLHIKSPVRVTIENLVIANGRTGVQASRGGGIYLESGELYVVDSEFIENGAEWGGAIYSAQGRVKVENSRFTSNRARWRGGAIHSTHGITTRDSEYVDNTEPVLYPE